MWLSVCYGFLTNFITKCLIVVLGVQIKLKILWLRPGVLEIRCNFGTKEAPLKRKFDLKLGIRHYFRITA